MQMLLSCMYPDTRLPFLIRTKDECCGANFQTETVVLNLCFHINSESRVRPRFVQESTSVIAAGTISVRDVRTRNLVVSKGIAL